MSMEGMRLGAQSVRTGTGGKGPRRSAFYARWKPPQMPEILKPFLTAPPSEEAMVQAAEPVVLIAGAYPDLYARDKNTGQPFNPPLISEAYRYRAHNFSVFIKPDKPGQQGFQSFREMVCSAGPEEHAPQHCVGCYMVDHGTKDAKPRDQWALNIAHLAWYHQHPLVDRQTGQITVSKQTNQPTLVKDECFRMKKENELRARAVARRVPNIKQPRQCDYCAAMAAAQGQGIASTWQWGDHRVLQVGFRHLKAIMDVNDEIGKKCVNCGTQILRMRFNCGHEPCNRLMVDIGQSGWTNEQIEMFEKTPQQCGGCGKITLPYSEYECGFNEQYQKINGGCPDDVEPTKMTAFDCVLWMQREGEKTETEVVIKRLEPIKTFKVPDGLPPLETYLNEIVKAPFEMADMYKPDSLDAQAESIKVQNPYAQQSQQYQSYGAQGYPQAQQPQVYGPPSGYGPPQQPQQTTYPNVPSSGRPNYGK